MLDFGTIAIPSNESSDAQTCQSFHCLYIYKVWILMKTQANIQNTSLLDTSA